ncbi:MAG TPA: hypothetical protein VKB76_06025, partial [Ktedonobacterales bacterium]|nr:hypothetical protein [Ktedonobacterales bacterium]
MARAAPAFFEVVVSATRGRWPVGRRAAVSGPIDIAEHAQLCSSLVRIAHRIGINRRLKNVTPSLSDYLEAHATEVEP